MNSVHLLMPIMYLPLYYISIFLTLCVPILFLLILFFIPAKDEKTISRLSSFFSIGVFFGSIGYLIYCSIFIWIKLALVRMMGGDFSLGESMLEEAFPAVFLFLSASLFCLIIKYCRYYLHREDGYKQFFATIFFFIFGMNLLSVATELLYFVIGWEVVGLSSFLLIGFYYQRKSPRRNAFKTYMVYRCCDMGLLGALAITHHLIDGPVTFSSLSEIIARDSSPLVAFVIATCFLLAALGKSAAFPFCFWLSRAMEGPTPSSAIFYGALSIHLGPFLLLQTMPLWSSLFAFQVILGIFGLLSALYGWTIGRVQSNIKGQIGYFAIAQVGLIFIELAFGLKKIAILHLVSHACLRCYQLLISPSIVSEELRRLKTKKKLSHWPFEHFLPKRIRATLFVFAVKEGYLDTAARDIMAFCKKYIAPSHVSTLIALQFVVLIYEYTILGGKSFYPLILIAGGTLTAFMLSLYQEKKGVLFVIFLFLSSFPGTPNFFGLEEILAMFDVDKEIIPLSIFILHYVFQGISMARIYSLRPVT